MSQKMRLILVPIFKPNLNRGLNSVSAYLQVGGRTLELYQSTIALTGE